MLYFVLFSAAPSVCTCFDLRFYLPLNIYPLHTVLLVAPLFGTILVLLANCPPEVPPSLNAQIAALRTHVPQFGQAQAVAEVLAACVLFGRIFT